MTANPEDELFARFRSAHDMAALAVLFDRVAPGLLQVARHLVRDPHAAEDLVQQTFLTALEQGADWNPGQPVVPWLSGILANRARRLWRDAQRVPDPERLAPTPAAAADAAALAAEVEASVARSLAGLPATYQPVLELHLREGLKPREIAVRLARPPGRIRVQLLRGLALLRQALPGSLATGVLGWFAPARGLAAIRAQVLRRAAVLARPPQVAVGLLGVGFMGLKLVCGVAAVCAVGLAWWAWPASPARAVAESVAAAASGTPAPVAHQDAAPAAPAPRIAVASIVASSPAASSGTLTVLVRWGDDRTPAEDVTLVCAPEAASGWSWDQVARSGADGRVVFTNIPSGPVRVIGDRGGNTQVTVPAGADVQTELLLPAVGTTSGSVVDGRGTPVAGATLVACHVAHTLGHVVGHSDSSGQFRVRGLAPLQALRAHARGYAPSRTFTTPPVPTAGGDGVRLVLGPATDVELIGTVRGPDGTPAAGARVALYRPAEPQPQNWADARRGRYAPEEVRTDAAGQFRFAGLPPGTYRLWARATATAPWTDAVAVGDHMPAPLAIALLGGATLCGRIPPELSDAGVAPAPDRSGVQLTSQPAPTPARPALTVSIQPEHSTTQDGAPHWVFDTAVAAADGSFCARHIRPGHFRAVAVRLPWHQAEQFTAADGATVTWDVAATRLGPIAGQLLSSTGQPLADWDVQLRASRNRMGGTHRTSTNADGSFRLERCEDEAWQVVVQPPRNSEAATVVASDVRIGTTDVRLTVPAALVGTAFLTGQLAAAPALPPQALVLATLVGSTRSASCGMQADGRFRLGPLPAGRVRVTAGNKDFELPTREVELTDGATLDLGVLMLEPRCTLLLQVRDAEGRSVAVGHVGMRRLPEDEEVAAAIVDGVARRPALGPGRYAVRLLGADAPLNLQTLTVAGTGEVTRELRLPASVARRVRYLAPSRSVAALTFVWRAADGSVIARDTLPWPHDQAHDATLRFVPGQFTLEVSDDQGNTARTPVQIADLTPVATPLELRLP